MPAKLGRIPRLVGKANKAGVTTWYWQPSRTLREHGWSPLRLGAANGPDPPEAIIEACRAENRKVDGAEQAGLPRPAGWASRKERALKKSIAQIERRKQWLQRQLKILRDPDSEAESCLKAAALQSVASSVYFIAALKGPIKIGVSTNVRSRLSSLQTSHSKKLRLLAETPGDHSLEAEYHQRFAAHRLQGEWFAPHADILEEIRSVRVGSSIQQPSNKSIEIDGVVKKK